MDTKSEIKAQIIRAGFTMQEIVEKMADEYDWSSSVSNFSAKLKRGSLRYEEALQLADALGYDIIWQKRRDDRRTHNMESFDLPSTRVRRSARLKRTTSARKTTTTATRTLTWVERT